MNGKNITIDNNIFYREVTFDDSSIISKWLNIPRVYKYLSSDFRFGNISINLIKIILRKKDSYWFIFGKDENLLGCVIIDSIDNVDKIGSLWCFLAEEKYLKQNITSSIIYDICERNIFKLNNITCWVCSNNIASQKMFERAKFKKIGSISNTFNIDGKFYDRILFQRILTKNDNPY
jgi:RimJ/RimL family protein N-acetyltransferase